MAGRFSDAVWVYDEATLTLQHTIPVPNQPYNLAIGPTGLVYVTQYTGNSLPGTVSVIDPASNSVVATVPTGLSPVGVTVSHDGSRLFVGNYSSSFMSVYSLATPASPVAAPAIPLPVAAETVTESKDGATLFGASPLANRVLVVDAHTGNLISEWSGLSTPHQVTLSTDGTQAFVAQQFGASMPIFSVTTNTQTGTIPGANTYFQSTDTTLDVRFATMPFSDGGALEIFDDDGAVIQTLTGITGAYYVATDAVTGSIFVTSLSTYTLTKVKQAAEVLPRLGDTP